jgi:hypothetical protein
MYLAITAERRSAVLASQYLWISCAVSYVHPHWKSVAGEGGPGFFFLQFLINGESEHNISMDKGTLGPCHCWFWRFAAFPPIPYAPVLPSLLRAGG